MTITFDPFCTPLNFVGKTAAFFYSSHITPLHSHNTLQLILDLKGTFLFRTNHTNWRRYSGVLVKENIVHQLNTNQGLQLIIYIDCSTLAAQNLKGKYLIHRDFCEISVAFSPLEEALIYKNFVKSEKKSIELLIQLIFSRMIDDSNTENSERISQILSLIKHSPPADLSIHSLAAGISISESRLREHFKHIMGVSLHQYIIKQKLVSAITSIVNGNSIQDAAYRSGFTDSSHLNKVMVKEFGITPSMFLKKSQTFFVIPDKKSFKLETQLAP